MCCYFRIFGSVRQTCEFSHRTLLDEEAAMKFPEKNESGFVFGAHRTQLPQFFATSPNVATLLARTAVRSVRNVQIASQHKMMRIQMAFFFPLRKPQLFYTTLQWRHLHQVRNALYNTCTGPRPPCRPSH